MSTLTAQAARVNSRTPKTKKSKGRKQRKPGDYTRRGRWLDSVTDNATAKLSKGAMSVATAISRRGGVTLNDICIRQTDLAQLARCSASTFREKIDELVEAGYLEVERVEPERNREGRWFRRMFNRYKFIVPKRPTKEKPSSHPGTESGALKKQLTTFVDKKLAQERFNRSLILDEPPEAPPMRPGDVGAMRKYLALGATKAAEVGLVLA